MLEYGKQWNINTLEDFTNAMETIDTWLFYASMSDDYQRELKEKAPKEKAPKEKAPKEKALKRKRRKRKC